MAKSNNSQTLQTVVEIAGSVNSSLGSAVTKAVEQLGTVSTAAVAAATAAAAVAVAVGKAVVSAAEYLVELGTSFDEAEDTIRIGTGATGEALEALMDDFEAVYSSVPTTMEDASAAIADYNTLLGLTGADLQNLSIQAIQVADLLDEDLDSVVDASAKAFSQWNIEADDMGDAMDYVFKVAQSTGMEFTDLMEDLQSYGAQFQEMGYTFEESAALIGQLEKAGVNTDEVLSAMKKSISSLADAGYDAEEGLQLYIDAIMNAESETNAVAIASEIFGTKAASTMAAAIRDGTLNLDDLTSSLEASEETINACAEDTYDFTEQLQIFKQQAEIALEPIASTLFDALNDLMPVLSDLMTQLIPIIEEMSAILSPIIESVVEDLLPILTELLRPILSIASTLATEILPPLIEIITAVLPVIVQLVDLIAVAVEPVLDILGSVLPIISTLISAIMKILSKLLSKILPVLQDFMEAFMPLITDLIDAVLPILVSLLDTLMPIIDLVPSILEPILDLVMAILKPALNLISAVLKPLITIIQTLINEALEPLQDVISVVSGVITGVFGAALEVINPIIETITNVLSGLIDFITNVFSGNWSGAWESIKGIFENIWNGVVSFFKGVINGLITIVETGINAIIGVINTVTSSLSKVWTWTGIPAIPTIPDVTLPRLASGGFTDGVSIAGEAGTEAVISFDPAYREQNIGYWEEAGVMLGVLQESEDNDGWAQLEKVIVEMDEGSILESIEMALPTYASGGFTDGVSIAGEAGTEAVISFDPAYREESEKLWVQTGKLLGLISGTEMNDAAKGDASAVIRAFSTAEEEQSTPLSMAGELLAMDGFSLGEMTETTIIYYDFSGFTWSPTVEIPGGEKVTAEDVIEQLKDHESEFFDWLEEWLRSKDGGRYDSVSVY